MPAIDSGTLSRRGSDRGHGPLAFLDSVSLAESGGFVNQVAAQRRGGNRRGGLSLRFEATLRHFSVSSVPSVFLSFARFAALREDRRRR